MLSTVTAGIQILPNGKDDGTHGDLTEIVQVIKDSGLPYKVGPMETVIEGELDSVFEVIKTAQEKSIALGASEVHSTVKIHYRPSGVSLLDKEE